MDGPGPSMDVPGPSVNGPGPGMHGPCVDGPDHPWIVRTMHAWSRTIHSPGPPVDGPGRGMIAQKVAAQHNARIQ